MKSTEAFNIRVFVTKSIESSPERRSLITEVSEEGNLIQGKIRFGYLL